MHLANGVARCVVHHIDIAWNGARLGSDQLQFFSLGGDTLR